nr:DegT/DnrJ/EryC1/StrS aminotransferase family protein [Gemmatimonadota bacterium]NIR77315.1 DegT/DnrJ/EryC1/StrS aminotransferase family protein [Gemmatimonadota bacterium]NIT85839.1 DegT/DnrJ/EryC1/StrS aminotransferase family protein [Gemmatimonadota bacterium]NIU29662.1 DegT/DnrJ/EryC1/StrS aminotransferase family protein [Gemmatimonadota bacterium]NIU34706.1 transcriptional regulator [Gemmatimonadota bacterium]
MSVPFLDLTSQYDEIRGEIDAAISRVLESQAFILGPQVAALEEEIADYVGVRHAVGCASGTDALLLTLMALEPEEGDEVVVP